MAKTATPSRTPAQKFLDLIRTRIARVRRDHSKLTAMAQNMADLLLAGGNIFTPPVAPFWVTEFRSRAGGFMCLRGSANRAKDIAYFALPDPRNWDPRRDQTLQKLLQAKAKLFVIGRRADLGDLAANKRFAGFTGGTSPNEGMYRYEQFRPFAATRPFEQFVRGWITTGEMICACIRAEKMPILWMSAWLEGSLARNNSFTFTEPGNFGEPYESTPTVPMPMFHRDRYIPPLPPGYAAAEFLSVVNMIVDTLDLQPRRLTKAGKWLARAHRQGRRIWVVATGYSHPAILELPDDNSYPLEWGRAISNITKAIPADLGPGDVALHLGYAPLQLPHVHRILKRGIKLICTSPYGPRQDMPRHPNFLWFDLPWRPGDACVDIPAYGTRMLPSSSTAHAIAYNAILCEMAQQRHWT